MSGYCSTSLKIEQFQNKRTILSQYREWRVNQTEGNRRIFFVLTTFETKNWILARNHGVECNGWISSDVDGPDWVILLVYHHHLLSEYPASIVRQNAGKNRFFRFGVFSFFFFVVVGLFAWQLLDYAKASTLVTRSDNGVSSWARGFEDRFSPATVQHWQPQTNQKTRFLRKDYSDRRHDKTNDMNL